MALALDSGAIGVALEAAEALGDNDTIEGLGDEALRQGNLVVFELACREDCGQVKSLLDGGSPISHCQVSRPHKRARGTRTLISSKADYSPKSRQKCFFRKDISISSSSSTEQACPNRLQISQMRFKIF